MKGKQQMPTKSKIIDGLSFEINQPYELGHTLSEAEAKALNQLRSENIGNNLRALVKKAKEEGKEGDLAQAVAQYDSQYTFSMGGAGGTRVVKDPVEREARAIAKEVIKAHLAAQGRKLSTVPEGMTEDQWKEKLEETIDDVASREETLKEARKAVAAKEKRSAALAESIGL